MAALRAHRFCSTDTIYYTITVRRLQNAEGTNFGTVRPRKAVILYRLRRISQTILPYLPKGQTDKQALPLSSQKQLPKNQKQKTRPAHRANRPQASGAF
jgi:hypothetical protein